MHVCILPTDTDLYVVAIRGVFEVVYGAHHVQGHVTDVMSVVFCLLRSSGDHHVGISNGLNLREVRKSRYCRVHTHTRRTLNEESRQTRTLKTRCFSLSVSNSVYMVLSMETTCMGVMWLQMRVNPTTSLNRMVTSGNTWEERHEKFSEMTEVSQPSNSAAQILFMLI